MWLGKDSLKRGAFEIRHEEQAGSHMIEKKLGHRPREGGKAYAEAPSRERQVQEISGNSFSLEIELEF